MNNNSNDDIDESFKTNDFEDVENDNDIEIIDISTPSGECENNNIEECKASLVENNDFICMDQEYEIECQQETFQAHKGSAFSAAAAPVNSLNYNCCIMTGGEDDIMCVWDSFTFDKIIEHKHNDSVISVGFNNNFEYALSADMSGIIYVYRSPNWSIPEFSLETTDIEWCMFHPKLSKVIVTGLKNWQIQIWEIPSCQYRILIPTNYSDCNQIELVTAPVVKFFHENYLYLISGYGDGSICIWNIKNGCVIHKFTHEHGFESPITEICIFPNDCLFAAGSESSSLIKVYDIHRKTLLYELNYYKIQPNSSVESILLNKNADFILSGTIVECFCNEQPIGGQLSIWNITTQSFYDIINFKDGITKMCLFELEPNLIAIGLVNGSIGVINFISCEILTILNSHNGPILSLAYDSNDNALISSSDDGSVMYLRVGNIFSNEIEHENIVL